MGWPWAAVRRPRGSCGFGELGSWVYGSMDRRTMVVGACGLRGLESDEGWKALDVMINCG